MERLTPEILAEMDTAFGDLTPSEAELERQWQQDQAMQRLDQFANREADRLGQEG